MTEPEDNLIRRIERRDRRAAVDALYRTHGARIISTLYLMLKDADIARDLAQETFVRAFTDGALWAGEAPLRPWLLKVATRLALNHVRERRRARAREERHAAPPGAAPDPLEEVLSRQLNQQVARSMQKLPLPYRQALVLRYHDGMSVDEVAAAMDLPAGTVMSHLYRARLVLRRELDRPIALDLRRRTR